MTDRRFSHAIADGEGISLIVVAEDRGAEALAISGDPAVVAHVVDFAGTGMSGASDVDLAFRVRDEEELERALEELDPELFVLAGTLEDVLELLAEVPAGKLVVAQLSLTTADDIEELERAGVDAVIVRDRELP